MSTLKDLMEEKNIILSKISGAAAEGKTDVILSESGRLEKIEILINRQKQISLELEALKKGQEISASGENIHDVKFPVRPNTSRLSEIASSRELGRKVRMTFLSKLVKDNIILQLIKGNSIYKTESGKRVGIAVATERQPNRWFLGLPTNGFDHAVLLCLRENEDLVEVLLPETFFAKYRNSMSQSNGQIKFNVVQRGGRILLQVPGTDGVSVAGIANDYSFLS